MWRQDVGWFRGSLSQPLGSISNLDESPYISLSLATRRQGLTIEVLYGGALAELIPPGKSSSGGVLPDIFPGAAVTISLRNITPEERAFQGS